MKKFFLITAALVLLLTLGGCAPGEKSGSSTNTSSSTSSDSSSSTESATSSSSTSSESTSSSSQSSSSSEKKPDDASTELIPDAEQSARVEGDRIIFSADNIFSQGEYYSVRISGAKCANQSAAVGDDTTYINGVLYGDFRLDLYKMGVHIDSLKINVPRDDSFMILENAAIGKNYGFTLMSHKREFSDEKYPDIVRLEFFRQRGMAVPQYARYFAVFENKIQELDIYENGVEVSPAGTFLAMRGDGLMTQNLTVEKGNGAYTVIKYEYRFDLNKRRLNRTQVKFTGWSD